MAINHLWDIDFGHFENFYKKCTAKPFSFFILAGGTTLVWNNPLHFRCNLLERIYKLIMKIGDKIGDEKLQYDINTEATKISALSLEKIDKYEYLISEKIWPSNQRRMIE